MRHNTNTAGRHEVRQQHYGTTAARVPGRSSAEQQLARAQHLSRLRRVRIVAIVFDGYFAGPGILRRNVVHRDSGLTGMALPERLP